MVYCNLIERHEDFAVYKIGTRVIDMTGEVIFYKDLREPEIVTQTETEPVRVFCCQKYTENTAIIFPKEFLKKKLHTK